MNFLNLGPFELAIIGVIALVVVGPRGLPELGKVVGKWMKVVKDASDEMKRGLYYDDYSPPPRKKPEFDPPTLAHTPPHDDEPAELVDAGVREESRLVEAAAVALDETAEDAAVETGETPEESSEDSPDDSSPSKDEGLQRDAYPYEEDGMD